MKSFAFSLILAATLPLTACVNNGGGGSGDAVNAENFDFVGMLANYADNIIVPNYETLANDTATLAAAQGPLGLYCDAIGSAGEADARASAQQAWKSTMDAWQATTLHELGPIQANNNALRNRISAFTRGTTLSTCGVDQAVVLADTNPSFSLSGRSANQRGLGAVEYLLFNDSLAHTCPSQITETADWNERPEQERKQLRCAYAEKLATDIDQAAQRVVGAWQIDADNYRSQFLNPAALDTNLKALSDALFFLDTDTKDAKLGIPLGISAACSQVSCPEVIESPFAQYSLNNISINVQSFLRLLEGGNGLGFDDIIAQAGVPEVTELMRENSNAAIEEIDTMTLSLRQQVEGIANEEDAQACVDAANTPDGERSRPACNLFGYIRRVTDTLKVGFVAAVDVDLPDRAQSDND
ncbi:imelysin family protein [Spongiibacter taiwanensis]|uniref:imelysin family protein n=1 Tax=Spongiibacter taiwanensis TaxID=1748242 RepID=UPI0020354D4B|nr:imelysin family protein [Spongiibacter taiwanensis]USA42366.1 imelysin family protein [Spongiibacter taiwanensis]